jgi:molybdopterin/thiamine biosynthesis adenylyltransferase/rhodanese-related sulfurtransferase
MDQLQLNFFDRQRKLPEVQDIGQKKLLDSHALIIGAGGLGSAVIENLARSGVGHFTLVDFDKVETSNLHRQILYGQADCGHFKVDKADEKIKSVTPWVKIHKFYKRFNEKNAAAIFQDQDIIIDCTDHLPTKFYIHDFAFKNRVNLVQSSIHKFDGQLNVFRFAENQNGCLRCLWSEVPDQLGSCNDNGVMGVVPALFGTLQATEAIKLLLDMPGLDNTEVLTFNLLTLEINKLKYPINSNCVCQGIKESKMSFELEKEKEDINFKDYLWLDIRIATKGMPLPDSIPSDLVIEETQEQIMESIDEYPKDKPFMVLCDRGMRSLNMANALKDKGIEIYSLAGGYMEIKP